VALLEAGPRRPLGLDLYRPTGDGTPVSRAVVELGKRLFHERRLSRDGSMACVSCHRPDRAFSDGGTVAIGVGGVRGTRNVPTIVDRAWGRSFFWDGRAATLEAQVLQPILDAGELGMSASGVVALARTAAYRERFAAAFRTRADADMLSSESTNRVIGGAGIAPLLAANAPGISRSGYRVDDPFAGLTRDDAGTLRQVAVALASYVRTFQSGDSPYDRYSNGNRSALDASAVRGLALFRGKGGCSGCHVGPLLSDEGFHNTGVAWRNGTLTDEGRARVTGEPSDRGAFKTPTLREVARTGPYMHDGSFATLEEVVEFYDGGGIRNPALDNRVRPLSLTTGEKRDLVRFLRSLSGRVIDQE
jgi:cytochrome c peroxidase